MYKINIVIISTIFTVTETTRLRFANRNIYKEYGLQV